MTLRSWYRIANAADGQSADLWVYDEIGASFWNDQAVTAKQFLADLQALPDSVMTLRVHVNSPGGDPFDATAIANALRAQRAEKGRTVEVSIEGLAASAASVLAMAGDPIRIADNALVMVHNPVGLALGQAKDLRAMAEALDRVRDSIVATYQWVSPLAAEQIHELMDAETWMGAEEAVANGFAHEIVRGAAVSASFRPDVLARLGTIPEAFRPRVEALVVRPAVDPPEPTAPDPKAVIAACKAAGFPELAEDLLGQPMAAITERLQRETAARTAAEARAREIRGLCAAAQAPALAESLIRSAMSPADVKSHLVIVTALRDGAEIQSHLEPDGAGEARRPRLNVLEVYEGLHGAKGA